MSRDWTPRESYEFEQYNIKNGHGDKWVFMRSLVMRYGDQTYKAYTDEEIALRQQFPYKSSRHKNLTCK